MGGKESNPFKESMSQYRVEHQDNEHNLTFLTHMQTNKEYLLRELTYND